MPELKFLPNYLKPRSTSSSNKKDFNYIPKKIFQTWCSKKVSSEMYDVIYTWIDKNPDWEYFLFDDNECRNFIKNNFPKKVLDAYDMIAPKASKSDLWRYCVLYIHGGLYVDHKIELLAENLNDIIPDDIEFLSLQETQPLNKKCFDGVRDLRLLQAFMVSKPKHPFLKKVIDLVVENAEKGYYGYTPVCPTGPRCLGRAIQLVLNSTDPNPNWIGINEISGFKFILWPNANQSRYSEEDGFLIGLDSRDEPILKYSKKVYNISRFKSYSKPVSMKEKNYRYAWCADIFYTNKKALRPKYNSYNKKCFKLEIVNTIIILYRSGSFKIMSNFVFFLIIKNRLPFIMLIRKILKKIFQKKSILSFLRS